MSTKGGEYPLNCTFSVYQDSEADLCIFHSRVPEKDPRKVRKALDKLRKRDDSTIADIHLSGLTDGSQLDFSGLKILDSDLSDADFTKSDFVSSQEQSNRSTATFRNVSFRDSTLHDTDCRGTRFESCDFRGSYLNNINFNSPLTKLQSSIFVDSQCNNVDFRRSDLNGADFSRSRITHSQYQGAILKEADFIGSIIRDVNFNWATLTSSNFTDADITDSEMSVADLEGAQFVEATIHNTGFVDTQLEKVTFSGASLAGSVNFGSRLIQEHNADLLICGEFLRDKFGLKLRTGEDVPYGREALKSKMGDDWADLDGEIPDSPPDSGMQEYYPEKAFQKGYTTGWFLVSVVLALVRPVRHAVSSFSEKPGEETQGVDEESPPWQRDSEDENSQKQEEIKEEQAKLEIAEKIYSELEAAYSGSAWGDSQRKFNIRKNSIKQKRPGAIGYFRQWLLKWTMRYGESPLQVLITTFTLCLAATFFWTLLGVEINDVVVRFGVPSDLGQSMNYLGSLFEYALRLLIGVSASGVEPLGIGSSVEFALIVSGKLLFAMFVYTLGRRAVV